MASLAEGIGLFGVLAAGHKPGGTPTRTIELEWAEPGIEHGQ
jgi:hypothetical protein